MELDLLGEEEGEEEGGHFLLSASYLACAWAAAAGWPVRW